MIAGSMTLPFYVIGLIWFLGWGFLLTRYPAQCYRVFARGKTATEKQVKRSRFVGYMGIFFGCLLLLEVAFGIVRLQQ
jgi:hypothetical protein